MPGMNARPREIKELQGTLRRHRDNHDAPKPTAPDGRSPMKFLAEEEKIFSRLKKNLPQGVATDAVAVATLARLIAKSEADAIGAVELNALMSLLGRFGMTPSTASGWCRTCAGSGRRRRRTPRSRPVAEWESDVLL